MKQKMQSMKKGILTGNWKKIPFKIRFLLIIQSMKRRKKLLRFTFLDMFICGTVHKIYNDEYKTQLQASVILCKYEVELYMCVQHCALCKCRDSFTLNDFFSLVLISLLTLFIFGFSITIRNPSFNKVYQQLIIGITSQSI